MIPSAEIRAAKELLRKDRKARKPKPAKREKRDTHVNLKARVRDFGFLSWLHEDIPCIACLIEGPVQARAGVYVQYGPGSEGWAGPGGIAIEAAHQKHVAGKGGMLGKRPSDADSCPLCAWHHRIAPNACDPAQRKFWTRLGVDVAAYCRALHEAFRSGASGAEVARLFARRLPAESGQ